jgi:hypothetical protein
MVAERMPPESWNAAFQQAAKEGGGVWTLGLVTPALKGNPNAQRLLETVPAFVQQLNTHHEPTDDAPVCLACGSTPFWRDHFPVAVVALYAARDDPSALLVFGLCEPCWNGCDSRAALKAAIMNGLRTQCGMDDLRELPPMGPAGHA